MGERERVRVETRAEEIQQVTDNLDYLGDPMDQMDLLTKKHHALSMYYQILKVNKEISGSVCCYFSVLFVCLFVFVFVFVCLVCLYACVLSHLRKGLLLRSEGSY